MKELKNLGYCHASCCSGETNLDGLRQDQQIEHLVQWFIDMDGWMVSEEYYYVYVELATFILDKSE